MESDIFPNPRIFKELYTLVRADFKAGYSAAQKKDWGLEGQVVELLEKYADRYNYTVHLTHAIPQIGFSGLTHKFDADIRDRDFNQCLFEVKYRRATGMLEHEDIMKCHHATLEYFLKLLNEQGRDEANLFRCFITNQEVNDSFRRFFYSWGMVLIDPKLIPIPLIANIFKEFQMLEGATPHILELIKRANGLIERTYFGLAQLVPPQQKHGSVLDLGRLNTAYESEKFLVEHKRLQAEIDILQRKYRVGKHK